jgi:hypothetical protein
MLAGDICALARLPPHAGDGTIKRPVGKHVVGELHVVGENVEEGENLLAGPTDAY